MLLAAKHQTSLGNLVLAWTIHQPGFTAALVGACDAAQAAENARAASIKLTSDDLQTIDRLLSTLEPVAAK